jgi:hypothetical protein
MRTGRSCETADESVEHWGEKQTKKSDADHSREDGSAEGLAHLGPGASSNCQREHSEDESQRRHEDRAQAGPCRGDGRFKAGHPLFLCLPGEFDNQDGVLRSQTDQHDQANLDEDVAVESADIHADRGGEDAHRHDQHYGERQKPALVKRRQEQEDKDDRKAEGNEGGIACEFLLEGDLGPFKPEAGRKAVSGYFSTAAMAWPIEKPRSRLSWTSAAGNRL